MRRISGELRNTIAGAKVEGNLNKQSQPACEDSSFLEVLFGGESSR